MDVQYMDVGNIVFIFYFWYMYFIRESSGNNFVCDPRVRQKVDFGPWPKKIVHPCTKQCHKLSDTMD